MEEKELNIEVGGNSPAPKKTRKPRTTKVTKEVKPEVLVGEVIIDNPCKKCKIGKGSKLCYSCVENRR